MFYFNNMVKREEKVRKGTHHSLETIKKISKSLEDKHPSKTTREKMSKSHIGLLAGEKSPMWGTHISDWHKEQISKSTKGKKRSLATREKISQNAKTNPNFGMKGKHPSPKTVEGMRERVTGEKNPMYGVHLIGEKNPNYQGGKSFEPYTLDFNKRFKENIKERDFHCCQLCNIGEEDLLLLKRYLVIHHIDYNKLLSIPQNCITLCDKCNAIANFNRNQWTEFFQSLLKERHNYQYTTEQKIILDYMEEIKWKINK